MSTASCLDSPGTTQHLLLLCPALYYPSGLPACGSVTYKDRTDSHSNSHIHRSHGHDQALVQAHGRSRTDDLSTVTARFNQKTMFPGILVSPNSASRLESRSSQVALSEVSSTTMEGLKDFGWSWSWVQVLQPLAGRSLQVWSSRASSGPLTSSPSKGNHHQADSPWRPSSCSCSRRTSPTRKDSARFTKTWWEKEATISGLADCVQRFSSPKCSPKRRRHFDFVAHRDENVCKRAIRSVGLPSSCVWLWVYVHDHVVALSVASLAGCSWHLVHLDPRWWLPLPRPGPAVRPLVFSRAFSWVSKNPFTLVSWGPWKPESKLQNPAGLTKPALTPLGIEMRVAGHVEHHGRGGLRRCCRGEKNLGDYKTFLSVPEMHIACRGNPRGNWRSRVSLTQKSVCPSLPACIAYYALQLDPLQRHVLDHSDKEGRERGWWCLVQEDKLTIAGEWSHLDAMVVSGKWAQTGRQVEVAGWAQDLAIYDIVETDSDDDGDMLSV